LQNNSK